MKWSFIILFAAISIKRSESFTLFKGEDHSDPIENECLKYIAARGTCVNLTDGYKSVRSVDTTGDCVQLYDKENCRGRTIKITSNIFSYHNLKDFGFQDKTVSVGTCNTVVDLYNETYFHGQRQRVKVWDSEDCVNSEGAQIIINSLDTHGSCIVLYKDEWCEDSPLKIFGNESDLSQTGPIRSIGSCAPQDRYPKIVSMTQSKPTSVNPDVSIFGQFIRSKNSVVIKTDHVPQDHYCELARRCTRNRLLDCQLMKNATACFCEISKRTVTCESPDASWTSLTPKGSGVSRNEDQYDAHRHQIVGQIENNKVSIQSNVYETPYADSDELWKRCSKDGNWTDGSVTRVGGPWDDCSYTCNSEPPCSRWCFLHEAPKPNRTELCIDPDPFYPAPSLPRILSTIDDDEDFEVCSST